MPILKTIEAPNGATVAFHKAMNASYNIGAQRVELNVASWTSQDSYNSGSNLVWMWTLILLPSVLADLDAALIQTSPFDGGSVVADTGTSLDTLKILAWAKLKDQRDAAINGGFTWDGSTFDSDPVSQSRIVGAVVLAQLAVAQNAAFSKTWVLADNTTRVLSATDMFNIGVALGTMVQAAIDRGDSLRAQIQAATTVDQLNAIIWTAS